MASHMNNSDFPSSIIPRDDRQGWTSSPNSRGTMDIVWSCMITIFYAAAIAIRKFILFGICAAAPELIFQNAIGQWVSARESVKRFHESGYLDWTLRHGFYVDMGGLHLRSPDYTSFPINSRQLHYLVTKGYVDYPRIEADQIRDKNKVDGMLRFITLVQTTCFIINIIVRVAQNLAITTLELSTSAFVFLSFLTTVLWIKKPADVQRCDYIQTQVPVATIMTDGGQDPDVVYSHNPLEFIEREQWVWSILWMHGLSLLQRLHLTGRSRQLPAQRFENTVVPVIKGWFLFSFAALSVVYLSIFIAAWSYEFPTATEQLLWRTASMTAMVSALTCFLVQQASFTWRPSFHRKPHQARSHSPDTGEGLPENQTSDESKIVHIAKRIFNGINVFISLLRNNSISQDPAFNAPARAVFATWFFGFFYASARAYILVADFAELRSLPASAYQTLNWSSLEPYIP